MKRCKTCERQIVAIPAHPKPFKAHQRGEGFSESEMGSNSSHIIMHLAYPFETEERWIVDCKAKHV